VQTLSEEKRQKILAAAGELFASRPFHKVLLSDVAAAAGVGKGTVYVYFKSKEDLYLALLYQAFENVMDQLQQLLDVAELRPPREALEIVVRASVDYSCRHPHLLELMRSVQIEADCSAQWRQKREELIELIEAILHRGIELGQFCDPHPDLTARFVPALIRSALLDGGAPQDPQVVSGHILRFLEGALLIHQGCEAAGPAMSGAAVPTFAVEFGSRPGETQHG
jgi:AcrR family transcriptional regulator